MGAAGALQQGLHLGLAHGFTERFRAGWGHGDHPGEDPWEARAHAGGPPWARGPWGRWAGAPRGGPFWAGPFGGGPFGGGPPWGRPPKAKRGDVRAAILALLAEEPRNGYQIIQEIAERSQGAWRPSPGAIYPALQQLADEGLIEGEESAGRRTFRLTEAGRAYVAEHPEEVRTPWEAMAADTRDEVHELFRLAAQAGTAVVQVVQAGSEAQIAEAREVLTEVRRRLYRILADGDPEEER